MRILIVEDDKLIAKALTTVLCNQHYAVEVATDGQAAWDLVQAFDYDLIILDVMLPKLDGISLCRVVRSHDLKMPILLLTGRDNGHDKAIGLDAGADDYVVKPFDCEELLARVRALLRRGNSTSQARFAGILDIADDAIISINTNQHITLFNQGAEKIFGYTAAEVIGQPLDLLLPLRYTLAHHQHVVDFATSSGKARRMGERRDILVRRKDGVEFPAEASISKLELREEIIFTVILRDITRNKQAQEALERISRQNELILNSMGEGLCGLDKSGRIVFVNPAAAKLLGYQVVELIGQSIDIILTHSKSDETHHPLTDCPFYESLWDTSVHPREIHEVFRRKNNSSFPVEYVSTPIQEQGVVKGFVVTFKDITDHQIVERMKDEFISVVSHELRTPLTSIHGSLGMLNSGLLDPNSERGKRLLEIAVDSTDRLVRLINDILDIERIESGKITMEKHVCDAADLMTETEDVMQAMAQRYGVNLSVSPVSVQLWADPDRIIQILTNLLSNAIKFSHQGGTVWLTAERQGDRILFQVKDRGRGIPTDKLESIFERFQQVDASDSRNHEGTGLGLAICCSIVQQHSGHIWVESQLGEGSTFCFTLPIPELPTIENKRVVRDDS